MYYISLILAIFNADLRSSLESKKDGSDEGGLSSNHILLKTPEENVSVGETKSVIARGRLGTSTSGPGLSPSSSVGSLSSEKSTLNPYAKVRKCKIDLIKLEIAPTTADNLF